MEDDTMKLVSALGIATLALLTTAAFADDYVGGAVKTTEIGGKEVLTDAKADGDFTLVDRTDGTKMWAYKGWPLYLWIEDVAPGDTKGDGVGKVWHTAIEQ
jgi:predicted lipoprotein with Yx(FWY)xxD motif